MLIIKFFYIIHKISIELNLFQLVKITKVYIHSNILHIKYNYLTYNIHDFKNF